MTADRRFRERARIAFSELEETKVTKLAARLAAEAFNEGLERAAGIAKAEEELAGPIPPDVLSHLLLDPEEGARAIVRTTKKSIVTAILAAKEPT